MVPSSTSHISSPTFTHPARSLPLNRDSQSSPGSFGLLPCANNIVDATRNIVSFFINSILPENARQLFHPVDQKIRRRCRKRLRLKAIGHSATLDAGVSRRLHIHGAVAHHHCFLRRHAR